MTFAECVVHCAGLPDLVREFNRLYGASLGEGSPIERMIDEATGRQEDDMRRFTAFVFECVWWPLAVVSQKDGSSPDLPAQTRERKEA